MDVGPTALALSARSLALKGRRMDPGTTRPSGPVGHSQEVTDRAAEGGRRHLHKNPRNGPCCSRGQVSRNYGPAFPTASRRTTVRTRLAPRSRRLLGRWGPEPGPRSSSLGAGSSCRGHSSQGRSAAEAQGSGSVGCAVPKTRVALPRAVWLPVYYAFGDIRSPTRFGRRSRSSDA